MNELPACLPLHLLDTPQLRQEEEKLLNGTVRLEERSC